MFLVFLTFLPLEMWHKLCCHNFETISNTVNEEPSVTWLFTWSSHAKQWEYHFHVSFQELLRVLHLLHFQELISSSCCYTFASHACNLGSHTTFFLSFDSFKSLSKHATIVVHENCWDSLKAPPDFFTFMWYSCGMWVITKTFPAVQDVNGTSAKTFPDMLYKTSKAFATHV